jgi:TonB family protein
MPNIEYLPFERGVREGIHVYVGRLVTFAKVFLLASIVSGAVGFTLIHRVPAVGPAGTDRGGVAVPVVQSKEAINVSPEVRPSPPRRAIHGRPSPHAPADSDSPHTSIEVNPPPISAPPRTLIVDPPPISPAPRTLIVNPPPITDKQTITERSECKHSVTLKRATGELPPDLTTNIQDLFAKFCDQTAPKLDIGDGSMTIEITFEIQEDGSVVKNSILIERGSGNDQFDEAIKKVAQDGRFPPLRSPDKSYSTVKATVGLSYSPLKVE